VQKVGGDVITRVPPIAAALPVWGFKAGAKADPIYVCGSCGVTEG
jgi:hypothetical protein